MTTEELNTTLYKKLAAEQEAFRSELLAMPPQEILRYSYEYHVKEDILLTLEYNDLSAKQCKALLGADVTLHDLFDLVENRETNYMEIVLDTIECRANALIRAGFIQSRSDTR